MNEIEDDEESLTTEDVHGASKHRKKSGSGVRQDGQRRAPAMQL